MGPRKIAKFGDEDENNWQADMVVPVKGKYRTELTKDDRKYIVDIARPSQYALQRI